MKKIPSHQWGLFGKINETNYTISLNFTFLQNLEHCESSMMKESKHERVRWAAKLIFTVGFFNIHWNFFASSNFIHIFSQKYAANAWNNKKKVANNQNFTVFKKKNKSFLHYMFFPFSNKAKYICVNSRLLLQFFFTICRKIANYHVKNKILTFESSFAYFFTGKVKNTNCQQF